MTLKASLSKLEKQFGARSIQRLGDTDFGPVEVIPTGIPSVDEALGIGGFPRGRIVEIIGPESSGKTLIALSAVAEAQAAGGTAAFVDAEHAMDRAWSAKIGVDIDNLLVSQPDYGEQALEITLELVKSGEVDIVVVDSVAALVPKNELEGQIGDAQMGLQARMMSQALRMLTPEVSKSKTLVIFINQLRSKIGVVYGSPETTTGGNALKFYASVRLDVRKIQAIKENDQAVGIQTRVKVIKNKVAAPFREASFDLIYGKGISKIGDWLDIAVRKGVVEKSGSWYSMDGTRLGQGRSAVIELLESDLVLFSDIKKALQSK